MPILTLLYSCYSLSSQERHAFRPTAPTLKVQTAHICLFVRKNQEKTPSLARGRRRRRSPFVGERDSFICDRRKEYIVSFMRGEKRKLKGRRGEKVEDAMARDDGWMSRRMGRVDGCLIEWRVEMDVSLNGERKRKM